MIEGMTASPRTPLRKGTGAKARSTPPAVRTTGAAQTGPQRLAWGVLALLSFAVPIVLDSAQKDGFRLPKALLGETLALVSLFLLSWNWRGPEEWVRCLKAPFVRLFGPFLIVATLVSLASPHAAHVYRGLAGLWIGAIAIWGWSVGFSREELRRLLVLQLWPAGGLAAISILQFHGLYQPYSLVGIAESSRLAVGSLAGNVGDLASYLVLPAIVAQAEWARGRHRKLAAGALGLCLYGLAVTQTLAALAAVAVGSAAFWALTLPARRWVPRASAAFAGALLLLSLVGPLRERALGKLSEVASGDWNAVLTGRLDGWRAAVWMLGEHPLTGVGIGAFRTEFIPAKTALVRSGVAFFEDQQNVVFANAHNELLEVGAETGWLGLLAFAFGLYGLGSLLRRQRRSQVEAPETGRSRETEDGSTGLAWAGAIAIGVLSMANFPFRIGLSLWPICFFLAWVLADDRPVRGERGAER